MVTILTPTYNRGLLLERLYHSLKKQTCFQFEWIIVDDGSTDNTQELVSQWLTAEHSFPIRYVKQNNGGKHRALNTGIPLGKFEFIFIIDSDDYIVTDCVKSICEWIKKIKNEPDYEKFAGISGLRAHQNGTVIGQYPANNSADFVDATNLERYKYKLTGDKAEIYRKDILLKFPFPEFEGENFLSECAVWDRIALAGYKLRWYNKIIYICEYLDGGLTKTKEKETNNFQGFTYVSRQAVHSNCFLYGLIYSTAFIQIARAKGLSNDNILELLQINIAYLFIAYLALVPKKIIKALRHLRSK